MHKHNVGHVAMTTAKIAALLDPECWHEETATPGWAFYSLYPTIRRPPTGSLSCTYPTRVTFCAAHGAEAGLPVTERTISEGVSCRCTVSGMTQLICPAER